MNLSWKKSAKHVGIGVTLLGLTLALKGTAQVLSYIVVAIIIFESLIILFENISTNKKWQRVVNVTGGFDATYLGLGLGIFKLGITYANNGWEWLSIIAWLISAFLMGSGIGENFGASYKTIVQRDWKLGVLMGVVFVILGTVQMIVNWKTILTNAIVNAPIPSVFIILGAIWIIYGLTKGKKTVTTESVQK